MTSGVDSSTLLPAWGKWQGEGRFHRLEHHCADVAACFEAILEDPVPRRRFAVAARQDPLHPTTLARFTVLAFLHDFAKINSGFQFKVRDPKDYSGRPPPRMSHVKEAFMCMGQDKICRALGFDEIANWGEDGTSALLIASLSHHGRPARGPEHSGTGPKEIWEPFAGYSPLDAATLLGQRIRAWFPDAFGSGPDLPDTPALQHLFAGTVVLADSIASDENLFRFESELDPSYIELARKRATDAIDKRRFNRASWPGRSPLSIRNLHRMFDYETLRPMQRAILEEAPLDQPLLILESETGSGKTEAALLRFSALWKAGLVDGLYFALPTRAGAMQLHSRVDKALTKLFPDMGPEKPRVETVLAVPGYIKAGDTKGSRKDGSRFDVCWDDGDVEAVNQARWSAESARLYLTSVAAVGTVDQALLAALKVKWAHFRGASLARSLLVVDEVHSSDSYMTQLLGNLLDAHIELGGHALLMSATLGSSARTRFIAGTSRRDYGLTLKEAEQYPYPVMTLARGGKLVSPVHQSARHDKHVKVIVHRSMTCPGEIAVLAADEAERGAKVLIIRNTVGAAQEVFRELIGNEREDLLMKVQGVPTLHHSRFAAEDRRLLDRAVERVIGKKKRSEGGVLALGTQTLEQSLDIDADLLITDLCPADVLLQRIGRLHRHCRADRSESYREPRCVVLCPENGLETGLDGGLLRYGLGMSHDGGGIYTNLLCLDETLNAVRDYRIWSIPKMNRLLVERATHEGRLSQKAQELGGEWLRHWQKGWGQAAAQAQLAREHVLDRGQRLTTDDNSQGISFPSEERVRTRLGPDGPRLLLAEPCIGPFRREVQTFNLPAHMFGNTLPSSDEVESVRVDSQRWGLTLHVGDRTFQYDRAGVRKDGNDTKLYESVKSKFNCG